MHFKSLHFHSFHSCSPNKCTLGRQSLLSTREYFIAMFTVHYYYYLFIYLFIFYSFNQNVSTRISKITKRASSWSDHQKTVVQQNRIEALHHHRQTLKQKKTLTLIAVIIIIIIIIYAEINLILSQKFCRNTVQNNVTYQQSQKQLQLLL